MGSCEESADKYKMQPHREVLVNHSQHTSFLSVGSFVAICDQL